MYHTVESFVELERTLKEKPAVLLYFSHDECNVCKVLKPKVADMLESEYPKMEMHYVNTKGLPEAAGQHRVFSVPTILVFFDGGESLRFSRNMSTTELSDRIQRLYDMMFEA
ncbi:MAG TPA: thioredoxin family protein [Bacteroidales bacterium]|nr:thioredoxin family protein [Bacteroidales bacterium]